MAIKRIDVIEMRIKKKHKHGKDIRILECKHITTILDFWRSHYAKQRTWTIIQQPKLIGLFRKRYRMVIMGRKQNHH
jgi:hypothetical protein